MLLNGQWIHSHALHAFFLSFPDIVGISNDLNLVKKYPAESKLAIELRKWALDLCAVIGGRTTHPINSVVGGFNVAPALDEMKELMSRLPEMLEIAKKIFQFLSKFKLPKFENPWTFAALKNGKEYACYDGKIHLSDGDEFITPELAMHEIEERTIPSEKVKRVFHNDQTIMTSSLARINTNFKQLNPSAKKAWQSLKISLPSYNSFQNIYAQAVEI
jgi:sulfhydrogenase subunit alpha